MRKPTPRVRKRVRQGIGGVLVYGQVFWLNLDSFQGNTRLSQSIPLLRDIRFIVNTFQGFPKFRKSRFQLGEFTGKFRPLEFPMFTGHVALSRIIQIQIHPCYAMLVEVDAVYSAHEHESGAPLRSELPLERSPIRFHLFPISFIAGALVAPGFVRPTAETFHSVLASVATTGGAPPQSEAVHCSPAVSWLAALLPRAPSCPFQRRCRIWCSREQSQQGFGGMSGCSIPDHLRYRYWSQSDPARKHFPTVAHSPHWTPPDTSLPARDL